MIPLVRLAAAATTALALAACSLGGLVGGGSKAPQALYVLTPQAPEPAADSRQSAADQAITVRTPAIEKELRTTRVPVKVSDTQVQYIPDMLWVDTPDRLFQSLLQEIIRRTTNRVVLDPDQTSVDPGLMLSGKLWRFGYDATTGEAVVRYEAMLAAPDGGHVQTRVFESRLPAQGTARSASVALNQAANQVALEVARWVGG